MSALSAARPLVSVWNSDGTKSSSQVALPGVMTAPIRLDIVHFVHTNVSKNSRQPYAVFKHAGHQHSAVSWGTGRAVSRIPRVHGSGTNRAGQGAFGNMCRKGRMFSPTKIWRRWHRRVNTNQRRYAAASALAASALVSLVAGRGHQIDNVEEIPLVVRDDVGKIAKTKEAMAFLQGIGALEDVERCKASDKIRAGKGKMRNRRHTMRKGPLIVYSDAELTPQAFRNIAGVDLANVGNLSLLDLAPGGHVGRFIIWTQSAFESLDHWFGTATTRAEGKTGYMIPRSVLTNTDLARIINSDEVQSVLRPAVKSVVRMPLKRNPLKNHKAMLRLNPYMTAVWARASAVHGKTKESRAAAVMQKRQRKQFAGRREAFYNSMIRDNDGEEEKDEA